MNGYTEEEKFWIWLASLGLGAKSFYQTLRLFGSAAAFFDAVKSDSGALQSLPADTLRLARTACSVQRVAEVLCELSSNDILALTRLSEKYPKPLASIPWPPPVLFIKGEMGCLNHALGIVGTRRCTRRGYEHARRIAGGLDGMCVVSGLARGIDTAAHLGALDTGLSTIAVLGCGVDVVYPPENEEIYYRIIQNGAVISELPVGALPHMSNFPVRNRIIAGLSQGLLVVESEMKGGTAITASLAVQYGKDIFAMPGPPFISVSELPDALITAGAVPVRDAADILAYYGLGKAASHEEQAQPMLDFTQARIYELLHHQDLSAEGVAALSGLAPGEVNISLTMMELSGLIRRVAGGKYGV